MNREDFKKRTKAYALRVIRLVDALPPQGASQVLAKQLLRAGTSVGANYRAACRAKSRADFVNKLRIVEEECDESIYWMELLAESGKLPAERLKSLIAEGYEILAMVVASVATATGRRDGAALGLRSARHEPRLSAEVQSPIANHKSPISRR